MSSTAKAAPAVAIESYDEVIQIQNEPAATRSEQDIAKLAYALWENRGCPVGSPEEDWFRAEAELNADASEAEK